MEPTPWTLDELSERTKAALEQLDLSQENGQVTDVPNGRTIRYYTTIGLLDRPGASGRTALYGRRHLTQLIAVKRLQARGLPLAKVQEQLLSLDTAALEALASLPPESHLHQPIAPREESRRDRDFWSVPAATPEIGHSPIPTSIPAAQQTRGLTLPEGVTLTFVSGASLGNDDIEALRAALGPVVETLRTRGLLTPTTAAAPASVEEPRKDEP